MFLVQYGDIYFVNSEKKVIYLWNLAVANEYLLRTWISLCFSLDYTTNSMQMFKNGKKLEPDFTVRAQSII